MEKPSEKKKTTVRPRITRRYRGKKKLGVKQLPEVLRPVMERLRKTTLT